MKARYALALAGMLLVPTAFAADAAPAAAAAPAAQAAPQGHGPMMMEEGGPMMRDDLKLTEEQKPKVKAIFEEAKAKHEAIRKETHDKLSRVLTPEQMKKLDEHREMKMEKRMDRMDKRQEKMKERRGDK